MFPRFLLAAFLVAHAAIHASFVAPAPPTTAGGPPWPFELARSWMLTPLGLQPEAMRLLGIALVVATIATFVLAAGAAAGVLPIDLWKPFSAAGAFASIALLLLFFHPWLAVGVLIDLGVLWAVLVAGWTPEGSSLARATSPRAGLPLPRGSGARGRSW